MACVGFACFLVTFVDVRRQVAKHTRTGETDNRIEGEKGVGEEAEISRKIG
jgi:hypothetical protein